MVTLLIQKHATMKGGQVILGSDTHAMHVSVHFHKTFFVMIRKIQTFITDYTGYIRQRNVSVGVGDEVSALVDSSM